MPAFRTGQRVAYRPHPGVEPERGVITEAYATVSASRVRYGTDVISKLTPNDSLSTDESAEEIVLAAALAGLGAARDVTAMLDGIIGDRALLAPRDWVTVVAADHRSHIAWATLRLEEAIRATMPLLTWAETGTAVARD